MRLKERRRIVSAAGFREPRDKSIEPFFGRIVSCGTPLTAPLTGRPCVMYHYAATHMGSGKSATRVTDAEGYALSPCAIDTTAGRIDVRAYLEPEFTADQVEGPARSRSAHGPPADIHADLAGAEPRRQLPRGAGTHAGR